MMALNIENGEVERLVSQVAELTGETKTEAVRRAPLIHGLEDVPDDVLHARDDSEHQQKDQHEHHGADHQAHLHPVPFLRSHHAAA